MPCPYIRVTCSVVAPGYTVTDAVASLRFCSFNQEVRMRLITSRLLLLTMFASVVYASPAVFALVKDSNPVLPSKPADVPALSAGWTELAEEQDSRGFAGVVGNLPVPGTGRIGAAEGALHGGAQRDRVDALAALETKQKETRGIGEAMGYVGFRATEGKQRRICSRWSGNNRHGEGLREREWVEPRSAL